MRRALLFVVLLVVSIISLQEQPAAQLQRNPGISTVCGTFSIDLDLFIGSVSIAELNDEAWAYVDAARKRRAATGVAEGVKVAAIDSFSNHDSHDLDFHLVLDSGQDDLMSIQDGDYIGVEWETGIRPHETSGDGASPTFPKWMWPSDGDRVWVEGNWIFDCGHPGNNGLYKTEIHPPRAMAVMREQAGPLPGTGVTPVPITRTDLYISGNGGFTPNQLNCGPHITLGDHGSTCGQSPPPADDSYKTTPINDTDYTFDVCLPPRPAGAVFSHSVSTGPRNTVAIAPDVAEVAAAGACATADGFDHQRMARVTVKLKDTATPPTAVYARHIDAGWIMPPAEPLPLRRLAVRSTNLFEDHDLDPGDGELSFWWVSLNRAPLSWLRLSDFATGDMNDYDDETAIGDGEMSYTNATFEFYLRPGQTYDLRSRGYEQDCYDTIGAYGIHSFDLLLYGLCNIDFPNHGAADDIAKADARYDADFTGDDTIHGGSDYDMRIRVDHLPLGFEDTAYLSMTLSCAPAAEVALVGQPLTCASRADNAGPGLPRGTTIRTRFAAGPPTAAMGAAVWSVTSPVFGNGDHPCAAVGSESACADVVVPVAAGTPAVARSTAIPSAPGVLEVRAEVSTISNDPLLADNTATTTIEVFQPIIVDVSPRDAANVINLQRGGALAVAIMTTADFDAGSVDAASVCFGDGNAPAERSCLETHGGGHLEDVNRDGRRDLLLHFDTGTTGIDLGDVSACLTGRTLSGTGFFGCDAVAPRQPAP